MAFQDDIKAFSDRVMTIKDTISTEEATKMSLVVPLFQLLGYDVFNPNEFCPEYVADVGIKKGEKVDYAIIIENEPTILIECKWCGEDLDKHSSQLFRYFGTSAAKFGILTNGVCYRFFTDLEETNKMDLTPFLEINFANLRESAVNELRKFCKDKFDRDNIFSTASELKYSNLIKELLKREMDAPSEAFVRLVLNDVYAGQKTQKIIEKFTPIVKKSFTGFVNEIVNQKISSALSSENAPEASTEQTAEALPEESKSKIITTEEELESYYIIRGILAGTVDPCDVVYRDTESYFGILYQNNNRKPLCRLAFKATVKYLMLPDENKNFTKYELESLNDIYTYKEQLLQVAKFYIE